MAAFDMQKIAEDGIVKFGFRHAQDYTNELLDVFDTLASHPEVAPLRPSATGTIRLLPHRSHNILYVVDDGDVVILRVLYALQNWLDLV